MDNNEKRRWQSKDPGSIRALRAGVATLLALCGLLLYAPPEAHAQHRIGGRVTDVASGGPLAGVQITVAGTTSGTLSDASGRYSLVAPSGTASLIFTRIGYAAQTVAIDNRSEINVALAPRATELEEIVAIGYGEKRRATLTESVGTVSQQEIQRVPVVNADHAIQGRVSGVQVTAGSGAPGSMPAVRIRGVGTVGSAQPLYVVDGVPLGQGVGYPNARISPLATINPADIESITVLKDASAAAVYGVQAANGVVLIQTRRGRIGKPVLRYDGYQGVQRMPQLWSMNDTQAYIALTQDAYDAYNRQNNLSPGSANYLTLHPDLQSGSRFATLNTDWLSPVVQQNAPIGSHNLSLSGATEQINYFVSAGYFMQDALQERYGYDRYSFRANTDFQVNPRLRFGETFTVSLQRLERGGHDGQLFRNVATMPPFFEIFDHENRVANNRYGYAGNLNVAGITPQANWVGINRIRESSEENTRVLGSLYGELDFLRFFTLRSQGSADLFLERVTSWNPGHTNAESGLDRPRPEFNDERSEDRSLVWTNTVTFNNEFGDHRFNVMGGVEVQSSTGTRMSATGYDFLSSDPKFRSFVRNSAAPVTVGGGGGEGGALGYLGRINYNYADRYLLTASVRRDGTSRFSPEDNRRWGTFPSVSAGWRISQEPFFNIPAISELKVRGSWGELGNSETVAYPHVFRVSTTPDYGLGGIPVQAPSPTGFVNRNIIWETVETADVGVELGLLQDQLTFGATYYTRSTRDFLVHIPIPEISGFSSAPVNAGSVLNRGVELEAGYRTVLANGMNLGVNANLTTVRNRLQSLYGDIEQYSAGGYYRTAVGFPIGYFYGFQTCGVFQNAAEATAAPVDRTTNRRPAAGDMCFRDINGDGEITPADRTYLGKTIPDAFYGLNFTGGWRGFDMAMFFQGVQGVEIYNEFRAASEGLQGMGRNQLASTANRWTGEGTSNTMPRAIHGDPAGNARVSDRWVEDGSFFRLRNVQLGYQLPARLMGGATDARVYVSASNLWTRTPYSGLDPEVWTPGQSANRTQLGAGTDQGAIPQPRIFQLGLSVGF